MVYQKLKTCQKCHANQECPIYGENNFSANNHTSESDPPGESLLCENDCCHIAEQNRWWNLLPLASELTEVFAVEDTGFPDHLLLGESALLFILLPNRKETIQSVSRCVYCALGPGAPIFTVQIVVLTRQDIGSIFFSVFHNNLFA